MRSFHNKCSHPQTQREMWLPTINDPSSPKNTHGRREAHNRNVLHKAGNLKLFFFFEKNLCILHRVK